jgi:hypothetical protein
MIFCGQLFDTRDQLKEPANGYQHECVLFHAVSFWVSIGKESEWMILWISTLRRFVRFALGSKDYLSFPPANISLLQYKWDETPIFDEPNSH